MLLRAFRVLVLTALVVLTGVVAPSAQAQSRPAAAAATVPADATVGPLFLFTTWLPHFCTASVIASPGADLIITAAHCVAGTEAGIQFAPGYHDGATPFGVWTVRQAYVDPAWLSRQDPAHDYAILRVDHQRWGGRWVGVQDVVGANVLGLAPRPGAVVAVAGYPFGLNDRPVSCSATATRTAGYPTVDCPGMAPGTSGGPWLLRTAFPHLTFTVGLIGGPHQGGCTDATSYSAPFTWDVYVLWLRAAFGAPSDIVPIPGGDGCSVS
ncbi:MAG: trypsin-like peptidase domain-containing protein [Mycobacteriaceae bacterium]